MGFLWRMLGDAVGDFANSATSAADSLNKIGGTLISTVQSVMKVVMPIVLAAVLAMGVFFCVKLGIGYAKAEKTEDREEAKKRLVGAVIGFGIGIVAAVVMWILFTNYTILSALFA